MALGDWLKRDAPTARDRLRSDLEEIEARLQFLESGASVQFFEGDVLPPAGNDGGVLIDLTNGNVHVSSGDAWVKIGAFWFDDNVT